MSLPTNYQTFIACSRYARWLPDEGRRENFGEVVDRFMNHMFREQVQVDEGTFTSIKEAILGLEVMPSMRAVMTAGPALARDATCNYNCAYIAVDHPRTFDETLYILMSGTGVGFSVERQFVNQLPEVPHEIHQSDTVIVVSDSKQGWASAYRQLIALLYAGEQPKWDTSRLRPAGAPLKTMGGRSSGPAPLERLFRFTCQLFRESCGRKLTSIECHSLMCMIGEIVVVGGVRRSAMISLSNPSDERMRHAKSGQWWVDRPYLSLANNSACYTELRPDMQLFMSEWKALYESKSGERGIFSRAAAKDHIERMGELRGEWDRKRDSKHEWGTNPCVTGDTMVATGDGLMRVRDLIGVPFYAVGPDRICHSGFVRTGLKEVFRYKNASGSVNVRCTKDHRVRRSADGEWITIQYAYKASIPIDFMCEFGDIEKTVLTSCDDGGVMVPVYDCKIDEDHWFVAGGLVVHNCSEIILRPAQMCNLSEVVARADDTMESLRRKIRIATILGTAQATVTHFKYLRPKWRRNCEDERLLGVSLTGIMDCPLLNGRGEGGLEALAERLDELRQYAIDVNREWSDEFGIEQSTAVTCTKPSGTVSQLVNSASGIHPRHSKYYVRTVRADKKDPIYELLKDEGVPVEDDVMRPNDVAVFSFVIESPAGAVTRDQVSAIEQLELWKVYATHWTEHKPSITVTVREEEWMSVGAWVYENFEIMSGISFLPYSDHTYEQAPYQEIDEETYKALLAKQPKDIRWERLGEYEKSDHTAGGRTYACTGDKCEVVDLV